MEEVSQDKHNVQLNVPCQHLDADGHSVSTVPPAAHEGRFQSIAAAQVHWSAHPLSTLKSTLSICTYTVTALPPCPWASYKHLDLCLHFKERSHSFVVKENWGRTPLSQENIWSSFVEERMEGKDLKEFYI